VHYEVHGRGRPVILLHGWLGSWGLWQKTMAYLQNDYRTYAMDFWGFGESGKKLDTYEIPDFVSLVDQFMEQLGIIRAPVIGHSMGGTVSMAFAIQYPERVQKVGVIGSPVDGQSLSILLKLFGMPLVAKVVHNALWGLKLGFRLYSPFVTKDKNWPNIMDEDLSKTTLESFLISIRSLRFTDLTNEIEKIQVPLMGIYGRKDVIVSPKEHKWIQDRAKFPHVNYLQDSGHFPMLDEPDKFMRLIKDFLDSEMIEI
jgi:pimeloyl-ACP methyl ester carboxylesterase